LLLLLVHATLEELAAICRFLGGQPLLEPQHGGARAPPKLVLEEGPSQTGSKGSPAYIFRKAGMLWEVVCDRGEPFYLEDTLGARYLDYLLHEPNKPISAFDLEVAITPEKGEARSKDSIQPECDPQAKGEYREALRSLQLERKRARKAGDRAKVRDLHRDIRRVSAALREHGGMADTGERARNNVRHAVNTIKAELKEGSREEQAFAQHLESHLSTGMECLYSQPEGRIWD
jgi:hypothetical protein